MLFPLHRLLPPAAKSPQSTSPANASNGFEVVVVFTSFEATLSALRQIRPLVSGLSARVKLLAVQLAPYPLDVEKPPVALEFVRQTLRRLASRSPVEMEVYHYLCRDRLEALTQALKPASVVVVGGSKRWWRLTKEQRLAQRLCQHGHSAIFLQMPLNKELTVAGSEPWRSSLFDLA